ncbi:hypothetical protein EPK99_06335 [Neorhizobium lilium]|uniref:Uncharacterized protein n=1 Tax=Neorhizobium lilium TaxID=2503024 RepID=A0A444LGT9_9HYPH|nr:hypothetical protein [Neorhizobium lilium]RWX78250.1 hypothetical protein EPK99_06335 [Neorhizobium lilium]
MKIASQHAWKDSEYAPRHEWPGDTLVQWGGNGLVLGKDCYTTAFFEAFPDKKITAGGGFIRGEGKTIEEAEADAFAQFQKESSCRHLWGREHYTNGGQLCRHCRAFRGGVVKEVVILGRHRKPVAWYHAYDLEMDSDSKYIRILRLRAKLFGITERPPTATSTDAVIASIFPGTAPEVSE